MNDVEFGFRVRLALNEGAEALDYKTAFRLEKARQAALSRRLAPRPATVRLPALQLAAAGGASLDEPGSGRGLWAALRGAGLLLPLLVLAAGFIGIYEWNSRQHIAQLADFDFAVLMDEAPIAVYADSSFGVLLQGDAESPAADE